MTETQGLIMDAQIIGSFLVICGFLWVLWLAMRRKP